MFSIYLVIIVNLFIYPIRYSSNYMCFLSRQAGHRLCNHIERAMLLLKQYSQRDDDELREFCLQACEAFVIRCPEAIRPHIPMVSFVFRNFQEFYLIKKY